MTKAYAGFHLSAREKTGLKYKRGPGKDVWSGKAKTPSEISAEACELCPLSHTSLVIFVPVFLQVPGAGIKRAQKNFKVVRDFPTLLFLFPYFFLSIF